jgi:hypothetical protein
MSIGSPPLLYGPIAPENNPPINPQYYQPSVFNISALSYGVMTTVTTAVDHNYVVGQQVRLLIPSPYGAQQLNEQEGTVISIPASDQVVVNINSIGTNPFISVPFYGPTPPQITAIGDINSGQINSNGATNTITYVSGSFINISPL